MLIFLSRVVNALSSALLLLLFSCADTNDNLLTFDNMKIDGYVVDSINRSVIADATVSISTKRTKTNSNGYYSVNLTQSDLVDNGAYLEAYKTGYNSFSTIIQGSFFTFDSPDTIFLTAK